MPRRIAAHSGGPGPGHLRALAVRFGECWFSPLSRAQRSTPIIRISASATPATVPAIRTKARTRQVDAQLLAEREIGGGHKRGRQAGGDQPKRQVITT
jgi:hypothetical protein